MCEEEEEEERGDGLRKGKKEDLHAYSHSCSWGEGERKRWGGEGGECKKILCGRVGLGWRRGGRGRTAEKTPANKKRTEARAKKGDGGLEEGEGGTYSIV